MQHLVDHIFKYRYYFIFVSIAVAIMLPALTGRMETIDGLMSTLAFSFLIICSSSIFMKENFQKKWRVSLSILLAMLFFVWLSYITSDYLWTTVIRLLLTFIYLFLVLIGIIKDILSKRSQIGIEEILGALSTYLLFGILGAILYALLALFESGSLTMQVSSETTFTDFVYFSFITLSTVGYGDISPLSPSARTLSVVLGIGGQFYMTVVVAIFVGKYISSNHNNKN